jgi:hypothetical protein
MRNAWKQAPVIMSRNAPRETVTLAKTVQKLFSQAAYQDAALRTTGPLAIEQAKRGRSLRELSRSTGLSPAYLSLVARGEQRISLAALQLLLAECEGSEA